MAANLLFGGKKSSPAGAKAPAAAPAAPAPAQAPQVDSKAQHQMLASMMFGTPNFAKAAPSERDPYDTPGHYWQKVERFTIKQSDNPTKLGTPQAILKKRVLWADSGNPAGSLQAGSRVAQVFDYTKTGAVAASKGFMAKVLDCSPAEVSPDRAAMLTDPETQPLAGFVVEVRVNVDPNKVSPKDGKPFTWVNYERRVPFPEVLKAAQDGHLDGDLVDELFPDGALQAMAEAEAGAQ